VGQKTGLLTWVYDDPERHFMYQNIQFFSHNTMIFFGSHCTLPFYTIIIQQLQTSKMAHSVHV